ncbi:alpha/beta hydrolase [Micromonospora sp. NPDC049559]|uniref:alpha/beta hydrolase family protein n=1 Tax=Micromonospora sp. NPDC049559 TaxID=3155923 RepID=UPI0034198CC7
MSAPRLIAGLITLLLPLALTDCGRAVTAPALAQSARSAPEGSYAVGVRTFTLGRGTARPLSVTVWYPADGEPVLPAAAASTAAPGRAPTCPAPTGGASTVGVAPAPQPKRDAAMAPGRFPVVLYSHGLYSLPELHAPLTSRWAAAGFVVAAPTYPHTNRRTKHFSRADIANQPGDAWRVIQYLLRLNAVPGDAFAGHLDATHVGAAGHSAGGYTTAGLFSAGHSERLRAGIIIAGAGMKGAFAGPPATMLFVHGSADQTVPRSRARAAYDQLNWPKAFLTLARQGHGEYLSPGRAGFEQVLRTTTDFLRWQLYGDTAAHERIPDDARCPGLTELVTQL